MNGTAAAAAYDDMPRTVTHLRTVDSAIQSRITRNTTIMA